MGVGTTQMARSNGGTARAQTPHKPPALAIRFANWPNERVTRASARREAFLTVSWCQVLLPPWLPASIWVLTRFFSSRVLLTGRVECTSICQ